MRRNRVAEKWSEFARLVLPPECSSLQRQEMKRAFYAGFEAFLKISYELDPQNDTTERDLQVMKQIADELCDFSTAIQEGRA